MNGCKFLDELDEDHPIKSLTNWNIDFINHLICLIDFLNEHEIKNLDSRLKEIKRDKENWKSYISELEFCKRIVDFYPEFIPKYKGRETPDIKVILNSEEIFFEVKSLMDTDKDTQLYEKLHEIKSDYAIMIDYDPLNLSKEYIEITYCLVSKKIKGHSPGKFSIYNVLDIEIKEKREIANKFKPDGRTWVCLLPKETIKIDVNRLREKILLDFRDKYTQFKSAKNIYWVIDSKKWMYDFDEFKTVFYGEEKPEVPIEEKFRIYYTRIYSKMNGLFYGLDECFKILNGIVVILGDKSKLLINPRAQQKLDCSTKEKLKEVLNQG